MVATFASLLPAVMDYLGTSFKTFRLLLWFSWFFLIAAQKDNVAESSLKLSNRNDENVYTFRYDLFDGSNSNNRAPDYIKEPYHEIFAFKGSDGEVQRIHYAVDARGVRANIHSNAVYPFQKSPNGPILYNPTSYEWTEKFNTPKQSSSQNIQQTPVVGKVETNSVIGNDKNIEHSKNIPNRLVLGSVQSQGSVKTPSLNIIAPELQQKAVKFIPDQFHRELKSLLSALSFKGEFGNSLNQEPGILNAKETTASEKSQKQKDIANNGTQPQRTATVLDSDVKSIFNSSSTMNVQELLDLLQTNLSEQMEPIHENQGSLVKPKPYIERIRPTVLIPNFNEAEFGTSEQDVSDPKLILKPEMKKEENTFPLNYTEFNSHSLLKSPMSTIFDTSSENGQYYHYVMNLGKNIDKDSLKRSKFYSTGNGLFKILNETGFALLIDQAKAFKGHKTDTLPPWSFTTTNVPRIFKTDTPQNNEVGTIQSNMNSLNSETVTEQYISTTENFIEKIFQKEEINNLTEEAISEIINVTDSEALKPALLEIYSDVLLNTTYSPLNKEKKATTVSFGQDENLQSNENAAEVINNSSLDSRTEINPLFLTMPETEMRTVFVPLSMLLIPFSMSNPSKQFQLPNTYVEKANENEEHELTTTTAPTVTVTESLTTLMGVNESSTHQDTVFITTTTQNTVPNETTFDKTGNETHAQTRVQNLEDRTNIFSTTTEISIESTADTLLSTMMNPNLEKSVTESFINISETKTPHNNTVETSTNHHKDEFIENVSNRGVFLNNSISSETTTNAYTTEDTVTTVEQISLNLSKYTDTNKTLQLKEIPIMGNIYTPHQKHEGNNTRNNNSEAVGFSQIERRTDESSVIPQHVPYLSPDNPASQNKREKSRNTSPQITKTENGFYSQAQYLFSEPTATNHVKTATQILSSPNVRQVNLPAHETDRFDHRVPPGYFPSYENVPYIRPEAVQWERSSNPKQVIFVDLFGDSLPNQDSRNEPESFSTLSNLLRKSDFLHQGNKIIGNTKISKEIQYSPTDIDFYKKLDVHDASELVYSKELSYVDQNIDGQNGYLSSSPIFEIAPDTPIYAVSKAEEETESLPFIYEPEQFGISKGSQIPEEYKSLRNNFISNIPGYVEQAVSDGIIKSKHLGNLTSGSEKFLKNDEEYDLDPVIEILDIIPFEDLQRIPRTEENHANVADNMAQDSYILIQDYEGLPDLFNDQQGLSGLANDQQGLPGLHNDQQGLYFTESGRQEKETPLTKIQTDVTDFNKNSNIPVNNDVPEYGSRLFGNTLVQTNPGFLVSQEKLNIGSNIQTEEGSSLSRAPWLPNR
ncbi:uncharacterized protein LOC118192142 [Stegodyphus dumicola]|uniref:uncharacterized protein LOC118192142 n=1 Tax=Stegodyphus dumicola TaxID=202533 RepID=UPI0015AE8E35|nr:uncharacterized protein LOC118192142 [Stegodyphus dumicola]